MDTINKYVCSYKGHQMEMKDIAKKARACFSKLPIAFQPDKNVSHPYLLLEITSANLLMC